MELSQFLDGPKITVPIVFNGDCEWIRIPNPPLCGIKRRQTIKRPAPPPFQFGFPDMAR